MERPSTPEITGNNEQIDSAMEEVRAEVLAGIETQIKQKPIVEDLYFTYAGGGGEKYTLSLDETLIYCKWRYRSASTISAGDQQDIIGFMLQLYNNANNLHDQGAFEASRANGEQHLKSKGLS